MNEKQKFNYKFTTATVLLVIGGIILAVACVMLNVDRLLKLIKTDISTLSNYLSVALAILVGTLGIVFISAFLLCSNYTVTDTHLISRWGIIVSKYELKNATRITHFRVSEKLVFFYDEDNFINVCIEKQRFDEFANAIRKVNPKVFYALDSENKGEK